MKAIIGLALAAAAAVLAWQLASPIAERWTQDNLHAQRLAALDEQQRAFDLQQYQARQAATLPAQVLWSYIAPLLAGAGAVGAAWLLVDVYRQRRSPLVRYAGGMLVPRSLVEQGDDRLLEMMRAAVEYDGQAQIARAVHTPGQTPASVTVHQGSAPRVEPPAMLAAPAVPTVIEQPPDAGLPDESALAERRKDFTPGQLIYGILPGNKPLILTYGASYHGLAAGDTRTGKSNWLDSIITQLHYHATQRNIRLWIGDYKREMASTWSRSPFPSAIETDPTAIAAMLVELANGRDGILQRYEYFRSFGEKHGRIVRNLADYVRASGHYPKISFAVVDELNALIEACDQEDELASALKIVLQLGAGAGCYVLSGAQYLTAKTFGRDGSKQFTTRALFGAFDQTATGMLFGTGKLSPEARALLTGQPGRGLIRTTGHANPAPFQALHCEESDILSAIEHYAAWRSGALTDKQPTVDISAPEVGISEISGFTRDTKSGEIPPESGGSTEVLPDRDSPHSSPLTAAISDTYDPRLLYGVAALRAAGSSKSAIIKTLWKATGGAPWQKASQEYEQIVTALESEARA